MITNLKTLFEKYAAPELREAAPPELLEILSHVWTPDLEKVALPSPCSTSPVPSSFALGAALGAGMQAYALADLLAIGAEAFRRTLRNADPVVCSAVGNVLSELLQKLSSSAAAASVSSGIAYGAPFEQAEPVKDEEGYVLQSSTAPGHFVGKFNPLITTEDLADALRYETFEGAANALHEGGVRVGFAPIPVRLL